MLPGRGLGKSYPYQTKYDILAALVNAEAPDITGLLNRWRDGDRLAEEDLFTAVLPNLRRLAQQYLNRERPGHTLQATELVDQMYLKLVNAKNQSWRNRGHFFAIVARAMRRYLIDYARGRPAAKFVALDGLENVLPANSEKTRLALSVDELLEEMGQVQPDWVQVIELKYFLGLTDEESAEALELKVRTFQRKWSDARDWLFTRMQEQNATQKPKPATK